MTTISLYFLTKNSAEGKNQLKISYGESWSGTLQSTIDWWVGGGRVALNKIKFIIITISGAIIIIFVTARQSSKSVK